MKWYYDPIDTSMLTANATMRWSDRQVTLLSLFDTKFTQTEHDANFPPFSASIKNVDSVSNYWEKTSGFSLRHHIALDTTTIQLGAQKTRSWALGSSGPTPSAKWDSEVSGLAASIEQRLLNDCLSLDAGLRRDSKFVSSSDTTAKNSNIDMPAARAISLGARWQATATYALNARYWNGDQGMVGDFNLRSQTDALHPEKQRRQELGIEGKFIPALTIALTGFDVRIDNQKSQTSTSYTLNGATYYYYTESNNRRTGYELLIKGDFGDQSHYKASWTHMTRNVSSNASVQSTNANDLLDFSVSHSWGTYTANASLKHVGPYNGGGPGASGPGGSFAADGQWHTIGDYTRFDASLSRTFHVGATAIKGTLFGRNLGNTQYMTIYPWTDRGRTVGFELGLEI